MSILVTGGAGFIGSHTCVELLENGYDVVVVDNLSNSCEKSLERVKEITGKEGDNFYLDYCVESGDVADKVILYEMRTAVYFANTPKPDEKKLRWWYWKDNNTENEDLIENDNI